MNVVIPMGGLGKRFFEEGYVRPKPLINVLGKPMLFWLLDCLNLRSDDVIYLGVGASVLEHGLREEIEKKYSGRNIIIIDIPAETAGATHTLFLVARDIPPSRQKMPLVSLDCDNFYSNDILELVRPFETNRITSFIDRGDRPIYSYVQVDEEGIVSAIKEKQKVSAFACSGCYVFRSVESFVDCAVSFLEERGVDISSRDAQSATGRELYTSMLLEHTIQRGEKLRSIRIEERDWHCLGTPFQLKRFVSSVHVDPIVNEFCRVGDKLCIPPVRICVDLDGTLCSAPVVLKDYSTCRPYWTRIEYIRKMKKNGHVIVINTARRMLTHNGNVGKIVADVGKITIDWLCTHQIPFDELYFGKPYADLYIDDKAISPVFDLQRESGLYDIAIELRDFNELFVDTMKIVRKSSKNLATLQGEIYWFMHVPREVADLFPVFIRSTSMSYEIEYIDGINLSYLFISGSLKCEDFSLVMNSLERIHACELEKEKSVDLYALYAKKVQKRWNDHLDVYAEIPGSQRVLDKILEFLVEYEKMDRGCRAVVHGDPVFTNIILKNDKSLRFLDMRGVLGDVLTICGDAKYDYAKVFQSLNGYDSIISKSAAPEGLSRKLLTIFWSFAKQRFGDSALHDIPMLSASLVFSLIPLHPANRHAEFWNLCLKLCELSANDA